MVTIKAVQEYLDKMYGNQLYKELEKEEKEPVIFSAIETLKDNFKEKFITERVVALQVLYMLEGEEEEFAMLKRQGVESYSVKGVSVSFDGSDIAPAVISILRPSSGAKIGRLI